MCGIYGIQNYDRAAELALLGLYALQHRGEEGAGVVCYDNKKLRSSKGFGLVEEVFKNTSFEEMGGRLAIAHTRYSTTGSSRLLNVQPFFVRCRNSHWTIAHNGNLTNTAQLRDELEEQGSILQTTMDSEILLHRLVKAKGKSIEESIQQTLNSVEGAYSLLFTIDDILIGGRDPWGVRPLSLGRIKHANGQQSIAFSSETCAFDLTGVEFIKDLEPGEFIKVDSQGNMTSFFVQKKVKKQAFCVFEQIYFARPDSNIESLSVAEVRKKMGAKLAQEAPVPHADTVMAVPDSGNFSALGFAKEAGIPFDIGIVRNHYVGRTFIQPSPYLRASKVKIKLNPILSFLKGRVVVLVEDSIVRGNTIRNRIRDLKKCGVKEIHLRISCPPIVSPCYYGIDFPSEEELIGANKTIKEIESFVDVDSLAYLSLEGLKESTEQVSPQGKCFACFDRKYPIKINKDHKKDVLERGN